jgi:hydrogenase large subunit
MDVQFDPVSRVSGPLALYANIDPSGQASDASAVATLFRGYENLLVDRDVRDAIFVSSRACGVCGASHSLASALALEMTFEVRPPHFGIAIRNVLSALDVMIDHPVALFTRIGPDYSEPVIRATNPELWAKAESTPARGLSTHGLRTIGDIMNAMSRFTGSLFREAMIYSRTAREAFVVMGGKYPHPQTIVPGGISATVDPSDLSLALLRVTKFLDYSRKVAAVWDDLVDVLLEADPRFAQVGASPPNFIDLGLWDDPEYYDGTFENSATWGEARWSTPGAIVGGQLQTTQLPLIDNGIEEFVDRSFYDDWTGGAQTVAEDPNGNRLSPRHPWNKRTIPAPAAPSLGGKYTWATAPRWNGNTMETGPGARLWITALAEKLTNRGFQEPFGRGMRFGFPQAGLPMGEIEWHVPQSWNALERNRARAYSLVQSTLAAYENTLYAFDLARMGQGARDPGESGIFNQYSIPRDHVIGAGFWGGPRGYISHHLEVSGKVIRNYQIVSPSTFVVSRDGSGKPAVLEQAVMSTPALATQGRERHIDLLRAVRSFDPCMSCSTH